MYYNILLLTTVISLAHSPCPTWSFLTSSLSFMTRTLSLTWNSSTWCQNVIQFNYWITPLAYNHVPCYWLSGLCKFIPESYACKSFLISYWQGQPSWTCLRVGFRLKGSPGLLFGSWVLALIIYTRKKGTFYENCMSCLLHLHACMYHTNFAFITRCNKLCMLYYCNTFVREAGWKVHLLAKPGYCTRTSPRSVILWTVPIRPITWKQNWKKGINTKTVHFDSKHIQSISLSVCVSPSVNLLVSQLVSQSVSQSVD